MKFVRIVGVAGAAAVLFLGVFGAGPALAAAPSVVINSPGADAAYDAYPTINGSITQDGPSPELRSASVALSSNDGFSSENATQSYPPGGSGTIFSGGGASITYSWTPKPKYNGKYTVTVTGTGRSGGFGGSNDQTNIVTRSFSIEIAPAKATGVAAGMDDNAQVTVTWKPNVEPDIDGYAVFRSYNNANPAKVGEVPASTKPTYRESLAGKPPGGYRYQVVAVRRARTCASASNDEACRRGIPGEPSSYSAAVTVRSPGATTTTSTTIKKPSGGGSTGGGSTGGGSTGGGSTGGGSTSGGTKTTTATGKTAPRNSGGFAPGGDVDLSQFGGLLGGNGKSSANGGAVDEGTYDGELPYDASEKPLDSGRNDNSLITIGGASVPAPNEDWVKFIGAGSLMTALLVHVLWFKQQVDALPLETISD